MRTLLLLMAAALATPGAQVGTIAEKLANPYGITIGPDGALYICEVDSNVVHGLDLKTHQVTVVAGNGQKGYSSDGGPATAAALNQPYEVHFDRAGNMFFVEMQNHVVRRVDSKTHIITTVAGTGQPGFAGDGGQAVKAQFRQPHSIALGRDGMLYICDIANHRIRRVDLKTGRSRPSPARASGPPRRTERPSPVRP